jgi:hypothetical protein
MIAELEIVDFTPDGKHPHKHHHGLVADSICRALFPYQRPLI